MALFLMLGVGWDAYYCLRQSFFCADLLVLGPLLRLQRAYKLVNSAQMPIMLGNLMNYACSRLD